MIINPLYVPPAMVSLFRDMGDKFFIFYHKDRPPMKFDVLEKLSWPRDEDLLTFRDNYIRKKFALMRGLLSHTSNVSIKLNSKKRKSISLAKLKLWITTFFDLSKYDFDTLRSFRYALKATYPGIELSEVTEVNSNTRVLPIHNPFVLIPPHTPIAFTYNHNDFHSNSTPLQSRILHNNSHI